MKSIKIKLVHQNRDKKQKLLMIFDALESISKSYLPIRLEELKSKIYKPSKEHYAYYRNKYPDINSGVVSSHIRQLDSIIRSYIVWCKKRHKLVTFPENVKINIPLRNDMFHFEYNKTSKNFNAWLKFLRIYFPINLCKYHIEVLKNMESISDSSIMKDQKGNLCLRLCFETKDIPVKSKKSLGIDLGIAQPIACSDGKFFGSGDYIRHKKLELSKHRAAQASKSEEITAKQSRWTNDLNHKLSRQLVDYCSLHKIGVLSMEDLKGSHLSNRKFRRYNWAFKDLINKVKYKAECAGLKVISVDPRYTSQTCSSCGQKSGDNRVSQSLFLCSHCGLKANADINAAKNICHLSVANGSTVNQTIGKA